MFFWYHEDVTSDHRPKSHHSQSTVILINNAARRVSGYDLTKLTIYHSISVTVRSHYLFSLSLIGTVKTYQTS